MKKPFKHTLFGKVLIGAGDALTGGTVSNLVYKDENTDAGKIDLKRAGSSVITLVLIYLFVRGTLTLEQIEHFLRIFGGN